MSADPRQVFLDSMLSGDLETSVSLIHPDCVIRHPPGVSYGGDIHGPEGYRRLIETLFGSFDLDLAKTETLMVDDYLIIRFWATMTYKATGKSTSTTVAEFYRFENGLVVEADNYYKSPEDVAALMDHATT